MRQGPDRGLGAGEILGDEDGEQKGNHLSL
jgi:hypothetical protein